MPPPRTGRSVLALSVLLLLLAACGGGGADAPTAGTTPAAGARAASPAAPAASPTSASAAGGASPTAALPPGTRGFTNPVYASNYPDPHVIKVGERYYAYATNGNGGNVPVLTSPDLVNWTQGEDAMPQLAPWVTGDHWAPEVLAHPDGRYILYYTAHDGELDKQCLGVATARKPEGPFVDESERPFICQPKEGGSIDASPFVDADGGLTLYWKNDGNSVQMHTYIYAQTLSPDGLKLVGKPKRLIQEDAAWEGDLVEAPQMYAKDGALYLFYSANAFFNETYALGYATCRGPLGPCVKAPENPILTTTYCGESDPPSEGAAGPGHHSIVLDDDGEEWIVYHAWRPDAIESIEPGRVMWIDRIVWKGGKPDVLGPTCGQQPVP